MTLKLLGMLVLSMLFSGLSAAYEKTHECLSSDGSYVLFENRPSNIPVRMYISEKCIDGKATEHSITLNVEFRESGTDVSVFKGVVVFHYFSDISVYISRKVDHILKYGELLESDGRYSIYQVKDHGNPDIGYISISNKYNSVFDCINTFCDYISIVKGKPISYTFRGRYADDFDPGMIEDVMNEFIRQIFNS